MILGIIRHLLADFLLLPGLRIDILKRQRIAVQNHVFLLHLLVLDHIQRLRKRSTLRRVPIQEEIGRHDQHYDQHQIERQPAK